MSRFDEILDRRASESVKWGRYAGRDILPLWVADMDFAAPPAVLDALHERLAHPVFGYGHVASGLVDAVIEHLQREYDWTIDADWLVWLPGLVSGLNIACRAVDGAVLSATPVYPPFLSAPGLSGRRLDTVALREDDAGWRLQIDDLEQHTQPDSRLFLLCHPHNPVGRCWRDAELQALADWAERRDIIVCSDEIHCGLILDADRRHRPFASLSPTAARRSITLMAPSKTFNIPGLGCAFAVIPDGGLRQRFGRAMRGIVPEPNVLGLTACEAAFRHAGAWHRELITYLAANRDRVESAIDALPGVRMHHVEATYLAWIDVRGLGLADPAGHVEQHGLGLSDGRDFGTPGWLRMNFGCPRATLDEALARFAQACQAA